MDCRKLRGNIERMQGEIEGLENKIKQYNKEQVDGGEVELSLKEVEEKRDGVLEEYLNDFFNANGDIFNREAGVTFNSKIGEKVPGFVNEIVSITRLSDGNVLVGGDKGELRIVSCENDTPKMGKRISAGFSESIYDRICTIPFGDGKTLLRCQDDIRMAFLKNGELQLEKIDEELDLSGYGWVMPLSDEKFVLRDEDDLCVVSFKDNVLRMDERVSVFDHSLYSRYSDQMVVIPLKNGRILTIKDKSRMRMVSTEGNMLQVGEEFSDSRLDDIAIVVPLGDEKTMIYAYNRNKGERYWNVVSFTDGQIEGIESRHIPEFDHQFHTVAVSLNDGRILVGNDEGEICVVSFDEGGIQAKIKKIPELERGIKRIVPLNNREALIGTGDRMDDKMYVVAFDEDESLVKDEALGTIGSSCSLGSTGKLIKDYGGSELRFISSSAPRTMEALKRCLPEIAKKGEV